MSHLNPDKLYCRFLNGSQPDGPIVPRRYTLTHSDRTGELFLSIGHDYSREQISGWYTRLMRDEVLAEWKTQQQQYLLWIYVHVSGGGAIGFSGWRNSILHREMPLVLEAIRFGERCLVDHFPELNHALVKVRFQSNKEKYNLTESWGNFGEYQ